MASVFILRIPRGKKIFFSILTASSSIYKKER